MARRSSRSLAALLIALAVAACAQPEEEGPTASSPPPPPTPTSTPDSTTLAPPTSAATVTSTTARVQDVDAVVGVPDGDGPFPAVVLVHGGGWVTGGPAILAPLATRLEENGYLTVNTRYTLATFERSAFPDAVDDVACAVRYAANHPDGDGTVAIVGHSAGAHIGALVALTGDAYGADCQFPGSGLPERFVGLAGPYDVSRLEFAVAAFFGGGPEQLTDAWAAGNPQLHTDQNVDLRSLILYGERDGIVPEGFSLDFYEALSRNGSDSLLELVEGARHNQMHDPELVGDLILTWLDR